MELQYLLNLSYMYTSLHWFNNLILLTRWWMPNSDLRHVDKKNFQYFESCKYVHCFVTKFFQNYSELPNETLCIVTFLLFFTCIFIVKHKLIQVWDIKRVFLRFDFKHQMDWARSTPNVSGFTIYMYLFTHSQSQVENEWPMIKSASALLRTEGIVLDILTCCLAYKLKIIIQAIYEKLYETQDSYFHRCFRSLSFVSDGNDTTAWLIHF